MALRLPLNIFPFENFIDLMQCVFHREPVDCTVGIFTVSSLFS